MATPCTGALGPCAADLRRFLSRHAKAGAIDAQTLARLPLVDPRGLQPLELASGARASLDRRVRTCRWLTEQATAYKIRIRDLARQLFPTLNDVLTSESRIADLAVLEHYGDPRALLTPAPTASPSYCMPARPAASRWPRQRPGLEPGWGSRRPRSACTATTPPCPTPTWPARSACSGGEPYVLRDVDGTPVTSEQARRIIATRYRVDEEVRRRRRSTKTRRGKAPQQALSGHANPGLERAASRRPSPQRASST